ncbi:MAG: arsenate reductase ArsC [Candidatus Abyssobacteria bacterium SURF_5]|uniref:Arsenate reductase ArsC n=1 Tax=Abyssobacteria bacterium (strain SURF_5) TaxID=2093360 RepID=A0A3A4P9Z0_ABYX5|nr:MAG: arsenate reductase ArsC [Candidatus Abyssubacteria bacterium SURF_5]
MKKILFVCVENSCRSQMAEGFANELGKGVIEAYSAGSEPSGVVNPKAIASMKEIGIDISSHKSKGLDAVPAAECDMIVTMGCGADTPSLPAKMRFDWDLPNPKDMPREEFNQVRDDIRRRVLSLLRDLKDK